MAPSTQNTCAAHRALDIIAAVAVLAVSYFARDLLIPVALAIFFAFLLAPLVRRLQVWGLGRTFAVFVIVILTFSAVGVGGCFVGSRAMNLVGELPKYRNNIVAKVRRLRESIGETLLPASQTIDAVLQEIAGPVETEAEKPSESLNPEPKIAANSPSTIKPTATSAPAVPAPALKAGDQVGAIARFLRAALIPLLDPIFTLALAAIFAIFFLIHREDLRNRILRICGDAQVSLTTAALSDAGDRISRYFVGLVLTNLLNGTAIAIGLIILHVPNALLFGALAGVLRFIPFLGTWIAAIFPTVVSIAFFDTWTVPLLVVGLFVLVDQFSAGVLEPWLYGSRTGASATAILLSMVVWTWLWGPIGLLLATPITVCLVVAGRYVPQFQSLYILLGDQPVLEPHARLYQRLLVMDEKEAMEIVARSAEGRTALDVLSDVIVPALSLMASDAPYDAFDENRQVAVRNLVDDALKRDTPTTDHSNSPSRHLVNEPATRPTDAILFGVHGIYDELTAHMVQWLLESRGQSCVVASPHLLIAEQLDDLRAKGVKTVCFVTVRATNASRIELLCRRISNSLPEMNFVAGICEPAADLQRLQKRLGRFRRLRISTTLSTTMAELDALLRLRPAPGDVVANVGTQERTGQNAPAFV